VLLQVLTPVDEVTQKYGFSGLMLIAGCCIGIVEVLQELDQLFGMTMKVSNNVIASMRHCIYSLFFTIESDPVKNQIGIAYALFRQLTISQLIILLG
jgi:hypothetical protein